MHLLDPDNDHNPAEHNIHAIDDVAPTVVEYEPALQGEHDDDEAVLHEPNAHCTH